MAMTHEEFEEARSIMESVIHRNYLHILEMSPVESLTPVKTRDNLNDIDTFLFIAKLSPNIYEPLKNFKLDGMMEIKQSAYKEGTSVIYRLEFLSMILESEIIAKNLKDFTTTLKQNKYIYIAVVDADTYEVIWFTNKFPASTINILVEQVIERHQMKID